MKSLRVLGVDPGSRLTGYGVLDRQGRDFRAVAHGAIKVSGSSASASAPLEKRLLGIFEGLSEVIKEFRPDVMAVERVFFAKNASSALKLGQARGAIVLTAGIHGLDFFEYSPTEVKSAICGHGAADKEQVARMLKLLLKMQGTEFATADASDALALALCHAQLAGSSLPRDKAQGRSRRGKRLSEMLGLE
jgi:crossover junction endodeoxyribonuclease RuvC